MLDTLLLVASLAHPPVGEVVRPLPVMAPGRPVAMRPASPTPPESLTTCYQSASGSCWSEP